MARSLSNRIIAYARWRMGMPRMLVQTQILERGLVVRDGAVRRQADKDDAWLLACALHAEVVFDIGSNVGQSALLMLSSQSIKQMVLVEANQEALTVAAENLIRNQLSRNIHFVPAFVGDTNDSIIRFWTVGAGSAGSMYKSHAKSAAKADSFIKVPTITLDSLCNMYQLIPDFIKIDVEGAEHKVLLGGKDCAGHAKTSFFVEMHANSDVPMMANAANVLDWCADVGYQAWYMKEGALLKDAVEIAHRGRCHLLLLPNTWPYPEWLESIKEGSSLESALPGNRIDSGSQENLNNV